MNSRLKLKIGTKLLLSLGVLFAVLTAANYAIQQRVVMKQFRDLEGSAARDDLRRCRDTLLREIEHLSNMTLDWAQWDDPYNFVVDGNKAFIESNLKESTWRSTNSNLRYFIDMDLNVVWGQIRDVDFETPISLQDFPPERFPAGHPLLAHLLPRKENAPIAGVMATEWRPLLICARPILTSDAGGPVHGTLIMGRFLAPERIEALRKQTCVNFSTYQVNAADMPAQATAALARLSSADDLLLQQRDDDHTLGYAYLSDPQGRPALVIEADIPRAISAQGRATMQMMLLSMFVTALLTAGLLYAVMRMVVVKPLEWLTEQARKIGQTADLTVRLQLKRTDELGTLGGVFDEMVARLADARAKLLETSRDAGMADVATGVLHNVGNVLNSVNVSTTMLVDSVKKSKVGGLARAVELLERNRANIAEFITQDERGRNLPGYLSQLAEALVAEQRYILGELGTLKTSVDHVNQVVQSQHTFARKVGHVEPTSLRELVRDSVAIMEAAFKRHGVEWHADLVETPTIQLDAAKCVQVLVNLLANAKEAVGASAKGEKRVDVRLRVTDGHAAVIEVSDNGAGIASENLTRIFSNGFTTKAGGRGLGLHYCALAAKEMGGELTGHSDGPGRGACFTLRLPLRVAEGVSAG